MKIFKYFLQICLVISMICIINCRPNKLHKRKANTNNDQQINEELLEELQMLRMRENRIQKPFAHFRRNFVHRPTYGRYQAATPLEQYYLPSPYNYDGRVGISPYPVFGGNAIY